MHIHYLSFLRSYTTIRSAAAARMCCASRLFFLCGAVASPASVVANTNILNPVFSPFTEGGLDSPQRCSFDLSLHFLRSNASSALSPVSSCFHFLRLSQFWSASFPYSFISEVQCLIQCMASPHLSAEHARNKNK